MKQVVDYVVQTHRYSQRKACGLTRQHRSTQRKHLTSDPRYELRLRMREISQTHIRGACPGLDPGGTDAFTLC